jgi:chloride channel 3/4/5
VGVTKAISDRVGKGGIADRMIAFNGFPFLDNKEDRSFGVPVSQAMTTEVTCFPASGLELADVYRILNENKFQGYPIVDDMNSRTLAGYIGRTELLYAITRIQREQKISRSAKCYFTTTSARARPAPSAEPAVSFDDMTATAGEVSVDFSRYIDATPISVHPRLPLETVMEVFKKMGPRVVLVEHRGRLAGLVTVKDCLKYQFKVEALENPSARDDGALLEERQEHVWRAFLRVGAWFAGRRDALVGRAAVRLGTRAGSSADGGNASPLESLQRNQEAEEGRRDAELELADR